jgi:hypothetical protein
MENATKNNLTRNRETFVEAGESPEGTKTQNAGPPAARHGSLAASGDRGPDPDRNRARGPDPSDGRGQSGPGHLPSSPQRTGHPRSEVQPNGLRRRVGGSNIRYASGIGRLPDTNSRLPKSNPAPARVDGHESPAGAEAARFLRQPTTVQN